MEVHVGAGLRIPHIWAPHCMFLFLRNVPGERPGTYLAGSPSASSCPDETGQGQVHFAANLSPELGSVLCTQDCASERTWVRDVLLGKLAPTFLLVRKHPARPESFLRARLPACVRVEVTSSCSPGLRSVRLESAAARREQWQLPACPARPCLSLCAAAESWGPQRLRGSSPRSLTRGRRVA